MTFAHDHIPNFKKLINNDDVLTQSTKNRSAEIIFNIRKIESDGGKSSCVDDKKIDVFSERCVFFLKKTNVNTPDLSEPVYL